MATKNRRAGRIFFKVNGAPYDAKGSYSYNLGQDKNEAIIGSDGVHGFKSTPQVAFIEGVITDSRDVDLAALAQLEDETVTLELANGKTVVLPEAWYAGEGTGSTEEGEIPVRFESRKQATEMK